MRFKRQGVFKKLYSFNLIFNYRGKTIALMFFSMSFLFRAAQSRNRPSDIWIWTRDPSYQIRGKYRKGKVWLLNYFENSWKKAFGYHFQALTFTLTIIVFKVLKSH